MVQKCSKNGPEWLPNGSQEAPRKGFSKRSANSLQKGLQKPAPGLPKGPQKSSIFDAFFDRFLGRLREPPKTASERIWKPFWLHFGSIFGAILVPKWGEAEKVKIELPPRRELNFRGPGHPQNDQKIDFFRNPFREGSRDPLSEPFLAFVARFWLDFGVPRGPHLPTFSASFFDPVF